MGTTSSFFGGSGGGGGNIGSSSLGSYLPLDTELPLYMAYPATNEVGFPSDVWAGNPLGNRYACRWISTNQFRIGNQSQNTIVNITPSSINASVSYLGGACYLSNGNILVIGSNNSGTPTFYYSEFNYQTGAKPTGGLDGHFTSTVSYNGFDNTGGINYNMLYDGTQFRIQSANGWWGRTSNMSSFTFEGYSGEGNGTIIGSNGIAVGVRYPSTATSQVAQTRVRRLDRSSDISSQTGTAFVALSNIANNSAPYSPVFGIHSTTTTRPRYIGYPDGKVWSEGTGLLFKLQEYDALCAEFQTKYVDVWEA
jgi:hypothetical protein